MRNIQLSVSCPAKRSCVNPGPCGPRADHPMCAHSGCHRIQNPTPSSWSCWSTHIAESSDPQLQGTLGSDLRWSHSCDFRCITVKHFEYSDEAIIAEHLKQQLCPLDSDDAIASHQIKTVVLSLCVKLSTTRCQSRGWSPYQTYRWRQSIRQQCLPTGVKEMTVTGSQFFAFTRQLLKALGGVSLLWLPHISK